MRRKDFPGPCWWKTQTGLGCVWINQLQGICDAPRIRQILDTFHIPADHVVYGMAAMGYKDGGAPAPKERIGQVEYIR